MRIQADLQETIDVMLKEYPSRVRFLRNATYHDPKGLECIFQGNPNASYDDADNSSPVNHFTIAEAAYCHNQMLYVAMAYLAQTGAFEHVQPLSLDTMNNKKFNDMLIREHTIKFSRPFESTTPFTGIITIDDYKIRTVRDITYLFTHHTFTFNDGAAKGESKGATILKPEEIITVNA